MSDLHAELLLHADEVWRIVVRLVSNEDDARDCYQQTFVDALRMPGGKVDSWRNVLRQIATRRAMDVLRRRYRDRDRFCFGDVDAAKESPPDASLRLMELRQSVRFVLAKLPPMQAEAFALRHIEQMEPPEIARRMGIDARHVRVLVHRAMNQVRRSLPSSFQPVQDGSTNEGAASEH